MHPTVVFDGADPDQCTRAYAAFDAILELGLSLGGTITGEHGVGFLKRAWLARELDEGSKHIHRVVKHALDPLGILNPGKMFAEL